jgi:hypothetical protein
LKIARILQYGQETFAIVDENGKVITRNEIIDQTDLILPSDIEEFMLSGYVQQIKDYCLSGTALSMSSNSKYLKHNDIVEVEIEKLGKIRNRVVFVN